VPFSGVAVALTQRTPTSVPSVTSCKNWFGLFAGIPNSKPKTQNPKLRAALLPTFTFPSFLTFALTLTLPFTSAWGQDQIVNGNLTVTSALIASGGTISGGASGLTINSNSAVTVVARTSGSGYGIKDSNGLVTIGTYIDTISPNGGIGTRFFPIHRQFRSAISNNCD